MLCLNVDRYSIVCEESVEINLVFKTSYELEELLKPFRSKEAVIRKNKVIWWGSNRFHFLTLPLYILRGENLPYLHIDLHPDDFQIYPKINAGSFVRYLPAKEKYYIGYIKPEKRETFSKHLLLKHWDEGKVETFIESLPNKLYISIDLDIVKRPWVINPYNKEAPLTGNQFIELLQLILPKAEFVDVCGFMRGKEEFKQRLISLLREWEVFKEKSDN